MVIITLTNCPSALRGDLSKWLAEINTGVYVGQLGARVRDQLWERVRKNANTGRATMVYSANNEQRMDFRVHNSQWEPIDFDGLKLMLRPRPARAQKKHEIKRGFSKAAKRHMARKMTGKKRTAKPLLTHYVVLDIETSGLSPAKHEIIEIGAIKVANGKVIQEYHTLIKAKQPVPPAIQKLTGITEELLSTKGENLSTALPQFLEFVEDLPMIAHNVVFDSDFLCAACRQCGLPELSNRCVDTLPLARRLVSNVENHKLETLAAYFGIQTEGAHRSACDCHMTKQLYEKLIEIQHVKE